MSKRSFPFAVRLIGFSDEEIAAFDVAFATGGGKGYAYARLEEDNLQDPDLYIANAQRLQALLVLTELRPSAVRPALLVGNPSIDMPLPRVEWPIQCEKLFVVLDGLVEKRADALSRLEASDIVVVPERRRHDRPGLDLTDPAEYIKMRAKVPDDGMVLVVDKNPAFRDHLADILDRYHIPVKWAGTEAQAAELSQKHPTTMLLINTSTPDVDPYRLCWTVKEKYPSMKVSIVFLTSKPFVYDVEQARQAGVDGYLNKPVASKQLMSVLKRFLPLSRDPVRA
ncbi:MAG TPA: response regulator [Noviherbaspirillum sp.]|nr:response regulator [Noviherbaspirillum sp.]